MDILDERNIRGTPKKKKNSSTIYSPILTLNIDTFAYFYIFCRTNSEQIYIEDDFVDRVHLGIKIMERNLIL